MTAKAHSEVALARMVALAVEKDWRAAAWLLERRFRDDYGSQLTPLKRLELRRGAELEAFLSVDWSLLPMGVLLAAQFLMHRQRVVPSIPVSTEPEIPFCHHPPTAPRRSSSPWAAARRS